MLEEIPRLLDILGAAESWSVYVLHWSDRHLYVTGDVGDGLTIDAVRLNIFRFVAGFELPYAELA